MYDIASPPQDARGISIRELRAICQSTAPAPERETFTGKRGARFFSIYFTKLFLRTPITPNQITVISVIVFFIGVCLFMTLSRPLAITGALLVFFATVLDGCDGEVSRFRRLNNPAGALYVEPVSHDIQYGFMFLPLAVAAFWMTGRPSFLILGYLAAIAKAVTRLIENRHWFMTRAEITPQEITKIREDYLKRPAHQRLISWFKRNLFTSNGMILPLFVAALSNRLPLFMIFYAYGYACLLVIIFVKQVRSFEKAKVVAKQAVPGSAD